MPPTGDNEFEAQTFFPMLGMAICVMQRGEPSGTYHGETEQADFLLLAGDVAMVRRRIDTEHSVRPGQTRVGCRDAC
ncbi:MAG: hypothetical protein QOF68_1744 [Gaiellales bacterium]|nr:hypothetical protein [Gaiellales bacterium]